MTRNAEHEEYMKFVSSRFNKTSAYDGTYSFPFRDRVGHIRRVYTWAQRLIENESCCKGLDAQAILIAAIFHDVGYSCAADPNDHATFSAQIFTDYMNQHEKTLPNEKLIHYLIKNHSDKKLLYEETTRMELVILMEADMLDETGALSLVWDCMSEGNRDKELQSFEATYEHTNKTLNMMRRKSPVTEYAKEIWEQKRELVEAFCASLKYDLENDI